MVINDRNFDAVFIDVDSCLCAIEGIDELAKLAGAGGQVAEMTRSAMEGSVGFSTIFRKRLALIQPRRGHLDWVARMYIDTITDGAKRAIGQLLTEGTRVYLLSGGYTQALYPLADFVGIRHADVFANTLRFDKSGKYCGYDRCCLLTCDTGKTDTIVAIRQEAGYRTVALIGDSATDAAARRVVEYLVGFAGYVRRPVVEQIADAMICEPSFTTLIPLLESGYAKLRGNSQI